MKSARVEQNLCIGCGLCCSVCDEVFRINEHGKAEAYQPSTNENQVDQIIHAVMMDGWNSLRIQKL